MSGAVRRVSMALHHGCSRGTGGQGPWATVSAGVLNLQEPALSIPCPAVGRTRIKRGSSQQPVCSGSGNLTRNLPHMASAILRGSRMSNGGLSQQCNKYENLWRNSQRGRGHTAEKAQFGFCTSPLTLHRPGCLQVNGSGNPTR